MYFFEPNDYQPVAGILFRELRDKLRQLLPNARIEHIGSSSIPGVISKGDLDIFVGVDAREFEQAISSIETIGFKIKEDTLRTPNLCPFESNSYPIDIGIQLVVTGSEFEFFIQFRELMQQRGDLRDQYNQLKQQATGLDCSSYRQLKSEFIEGLLAQVPEDAED